MTRTSAPAPVKASWLEEAVTPETPETSPDVDGIADVVVVVLVGAVAVEVVVA